MRCSTFRGTFYSLITLATPRQDWTGSNPSRREGGGCGFTLSRSHSCCAVRLFTYKSVPVIFEPPCIWGTRWHCATARKVVGSIADGVIGIFNWLNPTGLRSTQPLRELITWIISGGGGKGEEEGEGGRRCVVLTPLPPSWADRLEILEPKELSFLV